jgi:DNA-binding CsgD family transcriptional regulator
MGELYATSNLPPNWDEMAKALFKFLPPGALEVRTRPGTAHTYSELFRVYGGQVGLSGSYADWSGLDLELIQKIVSVSQDTFIVAATDPQGPGFVLGALLTEPTSIDERDRDRWRMLGAHLASGFRLRRGLSCEGQIVASGLPGHAEAVLDPKGFEVTDASGAAKEPDAMEKLRDAAVAVDRARGRLRKTDPEGSLATWWALLEGRWSLVDWFDTDGRRYVLAHPNPPRIGDPRGLSRREAQVVTFATLGETNKMIRYRLGVSEATVSRTLGSAMLKLNVKTPAQLVEKMRGLPMTQTQGTG